MGEATRETRNLRIRALRYAATPNLLSTGGVSRWVFVAVMEAPPSPLFTFTDDVEPTGTASVSDAMSSRLCDDSAPLLIPIARASAFQRRGGSSLQKIVSSSPLVSTSSHSYPLPSNETTTSSHNRQIPRSPGAVKVIGFDAPSIA